LITLALSLPVLYSLNMFWGFDNELGVADYPADWYEVDQYLMEQEGDFNVLFLPWHGYMTLSWNPKQRTMNPASMFFRRPIIRGENLEVGPIETESTRSSQHYVSFLLNRKGDIRRMGALLSPLNIRYVLLAKEADYQSYSFLYEQEDLVVDKETAHLVLLRNQADTAKFYFSAELARMGSWEDMLLAATRGRSLVDNAYLLEEGGNERARSAFTPITYQRLSPVRYRIQVPERGYVVFAVPFAGDWRLDGQAPQANLGLTNVFPADEGERTVYLGSFSLFLVPHALSALAFAGSLAFVVWPRRPHGRRTEHIEDGGVAQPPEPPAN